MTDPVADASLSVVAAIDAAQALGEAAIRAALRFPQASHRESQFPGRLATEVFADDGIVVKLRRDLTIPRAEPVRWIQGRLGRERDAGVYPADRSWLLVQDGDGLVAGTASRRRRPLHLWEPEELARRWEWYCEQFCELYLTGADHGWRLDEGPSNFAPDSEPAGGLVYLDDDLYPWDRGTALRSSWVVLARRAPWLTEEQGTLLGTALRAAHDRHLAVVEMRELAHDLRREARGSRFLAGLAEALTAARRSVSRAPVLPRSARTIALISDIHANAVALDAVLAAPEVAAAEKLLVLGDTVGYGPMPQECIDRLRADPRARVIRGNHDQAVIDPDTAMRFTKDARWVVEWTAERLGADERAWLEALPLELTGEDWLAVHGAPIDPARVHAYIYQMTAEDNLVQMELDRVPVLFYGNTHVAGAWARPRKHLPARFIAPDHELELGRLPNVLVCPGSVGQPRDGDPAAAYAIFDREHKRLRYGRAPYDIAAVQRRMRELGFPERLQHRLAEGR